MMMIMMTMIADDIFCLYYVPGTAVTILHSLSTAQEGKYSYYLQITNVTGKGYLPKVIQVHALAI